MNVRGDSALVGKLGAFAIGLFFASQVTAAPMLFSGLSSDGHPVSAIVDFVLNDVTDTVSVTLQNTTSTTLDSGELFTGLDFKIGGLTPTLTSATGIQRIVDAVGDFVDTGSPQNLTWSIAAQGGDVFELNFTPNAKDAIIGPPTAGTYAGANGSIKANGGHNPFAAQTANFELSVPGLGLNSIAELLVFRYGTTLAPATGTITPAPEPASFALAGLGLLAMAAQARRRR